MSSRVVFNEEELRKSYCHNIVENCRRVEIQDHLELSGPIPEHGAFLRRSHTLPVMVLTLIARTL